MTIDIKELIIQATVTPEGCEEAADLAEEKEEDERWVERISERVMQQLRESGGWPL